MKFCKHCGKEIESTATTCPYCGGFCQVEAPAPVQVNTPASFNQNNEVASNSGLKKASIVLGAIGIVMAWLLAILGYLFGGAALAMAIVAKNKGGEDAKPALIVSVIALVCSVISSIIGIILVTG